jgi:leucyl/phenylalanyl-tRNA--protein transferase
MYFITKELYFPPVEEASYEGVLAIGGDLSVKRLLLAYRKWNFSMV